MYLDEKSVIELRARETEVKHGFLNKARAAVRLGLVLTKTAAIFKSNSLELLD